MSFFKELVGYYDKFHDKSVLTNRFSYADFSQAMAKHANASFVEESLGQSVEGYTKSQSTPDQKNRPKQD